MKIRHHIILAATLSAGVAFGAMSAALAQTQNDSTVPTNPGFKANGQINPGAERQAPSSAPPGVNDASGSGTAVTDRAPPVGTTTASNGPIPTQAEVRAALMSADSYDAAIGQVALPEPGVSGAAAAVGTGQGGGDPTARTQGVAAIGGPLAPIDGAKAPSAGTPVTPAGAETTGKSPVEAAAMQAAQKTSPGQPIGSTGQTMPAKFSKRNDTIDRFPLMAFPVLLKADRRSQVYKAAMADTGAAAIDGADLKLTSELTTAQADAMRSLPAAAAGIAEVKTLKYLKTKDKVLLVEPSTRIVVDEIDG